jgi:hypothetical protein
MLNISWTIRFTLLTLLGIVFLAGNGFTQQPADAPMAEESPLLIEPETPEDAFEAASLMQRLGRPGLARRYLNQLFAANPDDDLLLKIRDRHGPAVFLRMANDPGLQPEAKQLLDQVNAAFRKRGADPARVNKLIADLSGGPRERGVALESLRSAGAVVVPQMLNALSTAGNNEKSAIIFGMVRIGEASAPPLLGALDNPNESVRGSAIEALGYVGSASDVPYLWRPAFGPNGPPATSQSARNALGRLLNPEGRRNFQVSAFGAPAQIKRTALEHFQGEFPWPMKAGQTAVTLKASMLAMVTTPRGHR